VKSLQIKLANYGSGAGLLSLGGMLTNKHFINEEVNTYEHIPAKVIDFDLNFVILQIVDGLCSQFLYFLHHLGQPLVAESLHLVNHLHLHFHSNSKRNSAEYLHLLLLLLFSF
jgi:hypothetical protein